MKYKKTRPAFFFFSIDPLIKKLFPFSSCLTVAMIKHCGHHNNNMVFDLSVQYPDNIQKCRFTFWACETTQGSKLILLNIITKVQTAISVFLLNIH